MNAKYLFFVLSFLVGFTYCKSPQAFAESSTSSTLETTPPSQGPPNGFGQRGPNREAMQELIAALNLSEDQMEQFKSINQKYRTQMQELREQNQGDRQTMMGGMRSIRENQQEEIKTILTEEQVKIFEAKIAEQRRNFGNRRGRGN